MIPAFSCAIAVGESPRYFAWSTEIGSTTATSASTTLVASQAPPMPTSTTATSTGASAKAAYAIPTIVSKKLSGWAWSASTRCVYGATSLNARTNSSSVSGSPSMLIRSLIFSRCGLVKRPVRRSSARTSVSIIRLVEVLPLVPVRWMVRKERCGSPSSSVKASIRSRLGSSLVSGQRDSRASSTSAKVSAGRASGDCSLISRRV